MPDRDEQGNVNCQTPVGQVVTVPPQGITYIDVVPDRRRAPVCQMVTGDNAAILWKESLTLDSEGELRPITSEMVRDNGALIDTTGMPAVSVRFDEEGTTALVSLTTTIVGLPLGIFVDDEFLVGPTIREPIADGALNIFGLALHEARILAAQINSPPLPVQIWQVEMEHPSDETPGS